MRFSFPVPAMPIQWFPGHMTAARKKAAETLARADVVIEVLDARLPEASCNPMSRPARVSPAPLSESVEQGRSPAATAAWLDFYRLQSAGCRDCKPWPSLARKPATPPCHLVFPRYAGSWPRIATTRPNPCA
jgi:ribosome biogenesis GTPase A